MKRMLWLNRLLAGLAVTTLTSAVAIAVVAAPSRSLAASASTERKRITFPPTLGTVPTRRVPGGTRGGSCKPSPQKLTALTPETGPQFTTVAAPTFWFYVPSISAKALELVLQDEDGQTVYRTAISPTPQPGIVPVRLADDPSAPALEVGKTYYWSFSAICNLRNRSGDLVVDGAIQRREDHHLTAQIPFLDAHDRAALYAEAGFWQDALTTLAERRRSRPADLAAKADWEDLLRSVGLQGMAQALFVPYGNPLQPAATNSR